MFSLVLSPLVKFTEIWESRGSVELGNYKISALTIRVLTAQPGGPALSIGTHSYSQLLLPLNTDDPLVYIPRPGLSFKFYNQMPDCQYDFSFGCVKGISNSTYTPLNLRYSFTDLALLKFSQKSRSYLTFLFLTSPQISTCH